MTANSKNDFTHTHKITIALSVNPNLENSFLTLLIKQISDFLAGFFINNCEIHDLEITVNHEEKLCQKLTILK